MSPDPSLGWHKGGGEGAAGAAPTRGCPKTKGSKSGESLPRLDEPSGGSLGHRGWAAGTVGGTGGQRQDLGVPFPPSLPSREPGTHREPRHDPPRAKVGTGTEGAKGHGGRARGQKGTGGDTGTRGDTGTAPPGAARGGMSQGTGSPNPAGAARPQPTPPKILPSCLPLPKILPSPPPVPPPPAATAAVAPPTGPGGSAAPRGKPGGPSAARGGLGDPPSTAQRVWGFLEGGSVFVSRRSQPGPCRRLPALEDAVCVQPIVLRRFGEGARWGLGGAPGTAPGGFPQLGPCPGRGKLRGKRRAQAPSGRRMMPSGRPGKVMGSHRGGLGGAAPAQGTGGSARDP